MLLRMLSARTACKKGNEWCDCVQITSQVCDVLCLRRTRGGRVNVPNGRGSLSRGVFFSMRDAWNGVAQQIQWLYDSQTQISIPHTMRSHRETANASEKNYNASIPTHKHTHTRRYHQRISCRKNTEWASLCGGRSERFLAAFMQWNFDRLGQSVIAAGIPTFCHCCAAFCLYTTSSLQFAAHCVRSSTIVLLTSIQCTSTHIPPALHPPHCVVWVARRDLPPVWNAIPLKPKSLPPLHTMKWALWSQRWLAQIHIHGHEKECIISTMVDAVRYVRCALGAWRCGDCPQRNTHTHTHAVRSEIVCQNDSMQHHTA